MTDPTLNLPVKWQFQQQFESNNANTVLGDSYQQFAWQGVTFDDQYKETLQVSATLTDTEKEALELLLLTWNGVQRFLWSPIPGSITARLFTCEKWEFRELGVNLWQFSANFEKTVDAPGPYVPGGGSAGSGSGSGGSGSGEEEEEDPPGEGSGSATESTGYVVLDDGSYVVDDAGNFVIVIENARVKIRYQWENNEVGAIADDCSPLWTPREEVWAGDFGEGLRPPISASGSVFVATGTSTAGTGRHYFTVSFAGIGNSSTAGTKDLTLYSGVTSGPDSCTPTTASMSDRVRNLSWTVEAWP